MNNLLTIENIYLSMGVIGSIVFAFKFISSMLGADIDDASDLDMENTDFKYLSLQTIALFTLSHGWMGLFLRKTVGLENFFSFIGAFIFACACVAVDIWLFSKMKGLHQVHTLDLNQAVGQIGKVYMTIPEGGVGEIQISFQGSMKNRKAMSEDNQKIDSFSDIKVVSVYNKNILIVTKV